MSTLILDHKHEDSSSLEKLQSIVTLFQVYMERHQQRKHLARLDPRLLKDVGLTREQVAEEVGRPFWK